MSSPLPSKSRTPSVSEISEINNNQKGADMAVIDMPRSSAVETEISEISPDLARDLLAKNPHNRNLRVRRVEQLAGAMTRGEWVFNGDAIRIADSGMLLDGQHRLAAIVRSAAYYFFSLVDPTDAELFITRLAMGTDLGELSPIHALRRQLTMPRGTRTMPMAIQGALTIKAWNYWRAGDTVKHLVWRPGGGTAEKFPMIDGLDLGDLAVAA